jgi:hypothetical protein
LCYSAYSTIDCGVNRGIAGDNVRTLSTTQRFVTVEGIDKHQLANIPISTTGCVVCYQHGTVIAILHQYAYVGLGCSIHSSRQLEWFKNNVNDKSTKVRGGLQFIKTIDGYIHPINNVNGLAYTSIRLYIDDKWD